MTHPNELTGKVCVCSYGKIGVICYNKTYDYCESTEHVVYYGVTFDGAKWQSKCPTVLADSIEDYIKDQEYDSYQ